MCNRAMLGPLTVKVFQVSVPNLSEVNECYWKYSFEKHELEGLGYVCPACGYCRTIKFPEIDSETGMVAWD